MARAGLGPCLPVLKAVAVLPPSFLIWSLTLPVLQARTTQRCPLSSHSGSLTAVIQLQPAHLKTFCSPSHRPSRTSAHSGSADPRVWLSTFLPSPSSFLHSSRSLFLPRAGHSHLGALALDSGRSQHLPSPHFSPAAPPLSLGPCTTIPSYTPSADLPPLTSASALSRSRASLARTHPPGPPGARQPPAPVPSS